MTTPSGVRPPIAYFGGKSGMAKSIVALMPPHRVYIEPYFGSGAVLFAKPRSSFEIVSDADHVLVNFFRVLRTRRDELEEVCSLTPHSRVEFDAAAITDGLDVDELELARRFWVRINQSFSKTAGRRTGWSLTVARSVSVPASILSKLGRFAAAVDRLAQVSIECCDGADLIRRMATTSDTVVYADPPYLGDTRAMSSPRGDYRFDMTTVEAHERLAEALRATPASVVLSGYPSGVYDSLYRGWYTIDREVTVHSSNARTNGRAGRVERLWLNYDPASVPEPLFRDEAPA